MSEVKTNIFKNGIVNYPNDPELVPRGGASDSLGWVTRGGFIELSRGKVLIGDENVGSGSVQGEHIGYKTNGTAVHLRKITTKIEYLNNSTWTDVITGLTDGEIYTFADHNTLSGSFVYASGYDGLFKINLANPGSYFDLTDDTQNFRHPGKIMISDNRMFMWDVGTETTRDKTGLYLSYIDSQNYSSVTQENIGTGNGVLTSFSDTLINASSVVNVLGVNVYAPIGTPKTVSDVTRSATPTVTATAHGLAVGDYVFFYNLNASNPGTGTITTTGNQTVSGAGTAFTTQLKAGNTITIGGDTRTIQSITDDITLTVTANFPAHAASAFTYSNMSQLNYKYARVKSVPNANSFTIDINTTSYTIYSSGATVAKAEVFTDDYNGNLVGNTTGTGTINYRTGAITVALPSAAVNGQPVLADYQYENSTAGGLADFTYSATRLAGEGDVFRQDEGGDAIQKVENFNGTYYSLKERSAYAVTLTNDDTNATNIIYRRNMGMPYFAASVSTVNGIVFLNTANPDQPQLTILKPNPLGNGIVPDELAPQFDFSLYNWDEC